MFLCVCLCGCVRCVFYLVVFVCVSLVVLFCVVVSLFEVLCCRFVFVCCVSLVVFTVVCSLLFVLAVRFSF